jgi:anti-sigma factor RsiW
MIPLRPGRRRPEDPDSRLHARAVELAAQRLGEPLPPEEDAWLEGHLAECDACAAVAAEYAADARLLRTMPSAPPPRDLWARTLAAIEAEEGAARAGSGRRRGSLVPRLIPLGALSGALVVGVVVLASLLSSPTMPPVTPTSNPLPSVAIATASPVSTPIAVAAGVVGWVTQGQDGKYQVAYAPVRKVCGTDIQSDCAPLVASSPVPLTLQATPGTIVSAPDAKQLVVVDANTKTTGGSLHVVDISGSASPSPSAMPSASPAASVAPNGSPAPSPSPAASASPAPTAATSPSPASTTSPNPSPAVSPSAAAVSAPPEVPMLSIAEDVVVVGETGAYSPDGRWFAYSARPADGSQGPDIYVWSPGEPAAQAVTFDHRSVFAGWSGDDIIGSRAEPEATPAAITSASPDPSADASATADGSPLPSASTPPASPSAPAPVIADPVSFILDPSTLASIDIPGEAIWRPVVDPSGLYDVAWQGTLRLAANGVDWVPDIGHLVVERWPGYGLVPTEAPGAGPSPSPQDQTDPGATPSAIPSEAPSSPEPSASGEPLVTTSPDPGALPVTLTDGPVRDWDMHWDETGSRLAVWVADPVDPTVGSLTLHTLDRITDRLDANGLLLDGQQALAGFSIGAGRLAWATPPGQGGDASRVEVLAWSGASAGRIETQPAGSGPLVVIR